MLSLLNLPKPSDELLAMISHSIATLEINNNSKKYFDISQNNSLNCSAGQTFMCNTITYIQLRKEFVPYLQDHFSASIGIFKNIGSSELSFLPPHIDSVRCLNLNYIICEGGKNVLTTLYKTTTPKVTKNVIQMGTYETLEIDFKVKTVANNWYAMDIQSYHSVDNIENQRVILSISFNNINYDYFKNKYEHLFVKDWLPYVGSNHGHFD